MKNGSSHHSLDIGLLQTDGDGLCRAVSADVCALLGKEARELTGQFIFTMLAADSRPTAITAWERIVASKEAGRFETSIVCHDAVALAVTAYMTPARGITALTDHWIVVLAPQPIDSTTDESELRYLRAELAQTKTHLEGQLTILKDELAQAHRAKEVLLASVETNSNQRIALLESDLAAAQERASSLENERRSLQESTAKLTEDGASVAARDAATIAARDESIARLTHEVETLRAAQTPQAQNAPQHIPPPPTQVATELAKLRAENLTLAERVRTATEEIAELRRTLATLPPSPETEATLATLRSENIALNSAHAELKTAAANELTNHLAALTTTWEPKLAAKTAEFETDRRALAEARTKNTELEATLQSLRESTSSAATALEAKLTAAHTQLAQVEASLTAEKKGTTELERRATEAEKHSTESSEFARTAAREFKEMLRKHDDVVAALTRAQDELGTTQRDLKAERLRADDFVATVRALRAENGTLRQERDTAVIEATRSKQAVEDRTELMFGTAEDFFERIIVEVASRLNRILRTVFALPDLTPASPTFLAVSAARTSADDLVRALDDIRDYWHLETGRLQLVREHFALRAWWSSLTTRYEFKSGQREVVFESRHDPDLPEAALVDGGYLDQSLNQLLDYLIETSEPGDSVACDVTVLAVGARDTRLRFELTSSGQVGITRHSQRLSVAIAEKIIRLLGGDFTFIEYPGEERRITIELTLLRGNGTPPVAPRPRRRTVREEIEPLPAPLIRRHTPTPVTPAEPPETTAEEMEANVHADIEPAPPPPVSHARIIGRGGPLARSTPPEQPPHRAFPEPAEPPPAPPPIPAPVAAPVAPPVAADAAPALDVPTAPAVVKVLLAEDNRINQRAISEILRARGYAVTVVSDGREALTQLSTARFDLALIDCEMPVMDGYSATQEIRSVERRSGRHTPIIAMTVYVDTDINNRCLEAGMDDLITKPVQAEPLLALIDKFLGSPA